MSGDDLTVLDFTVRDLSVPGYGAGSGSGAAALQPGSAAVPVREYAPAPESTWATLVWAHGGSFVRGTLDWPEADWVSRRFAERGIHVYSVDYALAGEGVRAPVPANDVAAVLGWAGRHAEGPLLIGGASAGAHLATLAALERADAEAAGDGRAADALILEYPTLHRVQREDPVLSDETAALPEARRFGTERISAMYAELLGGASESEIAAQGLIAGELPGARLALLPPTVIVNADADDLRASGEEFAEQLRAAGVPVEASVQPGTVHGYMNRPEESPTALADATDTIGRFVSGVRAVLAGGAAAAAQ